MLHFFVKIHKFCINSLPVVGADGRVDEAVGEQLPGRLDVSAGVDRGPQHPRDQRQVTRLCLHITRPQ